MNPDADKLWQAPRWALAVLLAVLGMLGPFSDRKSTRLNSSH